MSPSRTRSFTSLDPLRDYHKTREGERQALGGRFSLPWRKSKGFGGVKGGSDFLSSLRKRVEEKTERGW